VAKYGVVLSDGDCKEVESYYRNVAPQRSGLTGKNLERLPQLDDLAARDRLLAFPTRGIAEIVRTDTGGIAEALAATGPEELRP
jgi:hypothetical protein